MATKTPVLDLTLPAANDKFSVNVLNDNFSKIDNKLADTDKEQILTVPLWSAGATIPANTGTAISMNSGTPSLTTLNRIDIYFANSASDKVLQVASISGDPIKVGDTTTIYKAFNVSGTSGAITMYMRRMATIKTASSISFTACRNKTTGKPTTSNINNTYLLPVYIVGYKYI